MASQSKNSDALKHKLAILKDAEIANRNYCDALVINNLLYKDYYSEYKQAITTAQRTKALRALDCLCEESLLIGNILFEDMEK